MASAFGHGLAGYTLARLSFSSFQPRRLWSLAIFCALLPDIDTLGRNFGIPYDSIWGHRGFTHSLFFAAVLSGLVTLVFFRKSSPAEKGKLWIFFFLVTASHGCLDALTNGGRGVGFFIPFSPERYFFPWRPIEVSSLSVMRFFKTRHGIAVLRSEALWIGLPCMALLFIKDVFKRF